MNFDKAFEYVIGNEGGFSNDVNDRGGPTKYGITIQTLARYRNKITSITDVKNLTLDDAKKIYKEWYWNPNRLDEVTSGTIATCIFDVGVNMGVGTAAKFAQEIVNVEMDGKIGPISIKAINAYNELAFVCCMRIEMLAKYRSIVQLDSSQSVFMNGWTN